MGYFFIRIFCCTLCTVINYARLILDRLGADSGDVLAARRVPDSTLSCAAGAGQGYKRLNSPSFGSDLNRLSIDSGGVCAARRVPRITLAWAAGAVMRLSSGGSCSDERKSGDEKK